MRIRHAFSRLRRARQAAAGAHLQGIHNHAPTQISQLVVHAGGGIGGGNGQALYQAHVTGVQTDVHLHDGHTRLRITRFNGTVNRRSPAPARQERGMDIQAAFGWQIQHPLRQDQAIGGHHHHVSLRIQQGLARRSSIFGVFAIQAQAQGLHHGNAVLQRTLLDGRGLQLHATARRAVWLGQHQGDIKTSLE